MRKKIKAKSVGLYFVLLLYAGVIDFGEGHSPRLEVKHQGQLSSEEVKRGRLLSSLKFPKENRSQFHFQPLSYQETFEVIDEDKVQSSDNDIGPAEPVSASLVEILEEKSPNQVQNDDFKQPLQTKNSLHFSTTFAFPQHKVHTLQTGHRKTLVKLKQKSARFYPSSSKSKIFTRVSIPGKHRIFNTSHAGPNWTKLLLSRKFTSLKHNTSNESAFQLSNNIKVTDEARKRINQTERYQASSRDILEAFISRMGLKEGSELQPEPSPRVEVPERLSHPGPPKTVLLKKGNTNLSPKKASLQWTSNQRGGYQNFYSARKSTSLSTNSLKSPTVNTGVPLEKKEKTSPLEPEVFDSLPQKIFLNSIKNSTSNGGKYYVNNRPNLRILTSSLRDKDAHFLDNNKSGLETHLKSQASPLSPGVNNTQTKATTPQLKKNKSQDKNRTIVMGRDKSGLGTHPESQVSPLSPGVNNTQMTATTPRLKKNKSQDKNRTIVIGRVKSGLGTHPESQVSPLSPGVNNIQTKATTPQLKKNKSQDKNRTIVMGRVKSGLGTHPESQVSPLSPGVNNIQTKATTPQLKKNKSQDKNRTIVMGRVKSGLGTHPESQVSPLSPGVNNTQTKATTPKLKKNKSQDKNRTIVMGRDKSGLGTHPESQVSPLSPGVNNTQMTATTPRLKKNKSQDKNRTIVIGRVKSGLGTHPESQVSPLSPGVNNIQTKATTPQLKKNKSQDKNRTIVMGRVKSGLGTHPESQVSPLSPGVNNTQTKATTPKLKKNKSQDKNRTIVMGRDKSGLGTHPESQVSPLSPGVNNTQTKATTPKLKKNKSQDKNRTIVTGRDKSGLETHPGSQVSPLSPRVNNTETKGTTLTQQQKKNKSQDKSRNIVRGREKSGLRTRPKSQASPKSTSVNIIKTNTTTTQQKNNKTQGNSSNIVTGRDKSGLGTRPTNKVPSLSPSANNTKTNTTTTQLKNNKTQDKSGNTRDYPKIETNEKHLVNHIKNGSHNLVLTHARKNATHLNSTKLSVETTGTFTSLLGSNISMKHFSDLINFFNSFNSSSDKKPTSNNSTKGNSHVSNKFKTGTRNPIVSQNLLKFLDFVHTKTTSGNYTSKRLKLGEEHAHSDHNFIADQIKKQLQMSIYRGWNKASKGRRLGSKKLLTSLHPSVKSKLTNLHDTTRLRGNDSFAKSKGDNFELGVLQMMKNVSQKELLKLEGDIVNALSSAKLWNLQQRHENQNPGQQHQISPEKTKDKQLIYRQHNKQENLSGKQLNYQQQLNKQLQMLKHSNSKLGQQQNQTERKSKQTKQQIEENNNGNKLHQKELKFESEQSHLQQNNHESHHIKRKNMSHSLESITTVQNSSLLVCVNTTKKSPNYGCKQTHNESSPKNNGRKDIFSHFSNTSQTKTGGLVKIAHTLHNAASVQSPLAHHSSARKITENNTLPLRTGDGTFVTIPGFDVAKEVDDTKNISVQLDRAQEPVNTESISEGTAGSGIVELTEFVDQVPDKENVTTKWSEWTPCSKTCGDAKRKRIEYRCTSSSPEIRDCTVSGLQHEACVFKPCPVDGRFTTWTRWSTCSRSCGFKGFSVRSRSCTAPKHGGQPCYGAGIDTRECNRKHCPVNGGLSKWSKFGLCSKSCGGGVRMRHRECNNPVPRYGGAECDPTDLFETQSCGNMKCPAKTLKRLQVADVDPKSLCDFNPCNEAGCLHDPAARCITDFECNPVFFNVDGDMLSNCKGMDNLFSRIPEVICSYNPCLSEKCWEIRDQCVVDLKCRPVFIGIDRRLIPPQCQVHATARVDRLRGDQTWTKSFPKSRPAPVNLASDLMPSFTRLWYPVASFNRIQQFERMTDVNNYPLTFSRTLNTSPTMANSKHTVQSLEQRPVTEIFIEKVPNGNQIDDGDDNDDADDNDDVDESNADEDDDDDGTVFSDFDEDG